MSIPPSFRALLPGLKAPTVVASKQNPGSCNDLETKKPPLFCRRRFFIPGDQLINMKINLNEQFAIIKRLSLVLPA